MTVELWMLLASAAMMLVLPLVYGPGFIAALGAPVMIGNRDNFPPVDGWFARAKRAHANLQENLLPFAIAVLTAYATGLHDRWTQGAAILFFAARIVHVVSYTAGFTPARAPAYGIGVVAIAIILVRIVIRSIY